MGLHGPAFAVGAVYVRGGTVVQWVQWHCTPVGRYLPDDLAWVMEHVPLLRDAVPPTHTSPFGLRSDFWEWWQGLSDPVPALVCDVPWPVEARFLAACIDDDPVARNWLGPYPLVDVASVRLAQGMDPLVTGERRPDEVPAHNPLPDARQSARLLIEALSRCGDWMGAIQAWFAAPPEGDDE